MKDVLIVSGNCQAGVFAHALYHIPWVVERFEFFHEPWQYRTNAFPPVSEESWRRCAIHWHHLGVNPSEKEAKLNSPASAARIAFPPLDLTVMWPFHTHDALFQADPPEFENSKYPEPDRLVVQLSESNPATFNLPASPSDDLNAWVAQYNRMAEAGAENLERRVEMEAQRLIARDLQVDVPIGGFIISRFRTSRLFYTRNHPTCPTLVAMFERLLERTWPEACRPGGPLYDVGERIFHNWDPFSNHQVPVSRAVAKRLGLTWWLEHMLYRTDASFRHVLCQTADQYIGGYLTDRVAKVSARREARKSA